MAEIAACRVSGATLRRRMRSVEGSGLYTIEVICTRLLQETGPPAMSAIGTKRTLRLPPGMSAGGCKEDIARTCRNGRYVPKRMSDGVQGLHFYGTVIHLGPSTSVEL